jgi:hypothetical protein
VSAKATPPAVVVPAEPAPRFDLERMTPEVGWMMIGVGVLGVILPGLPGWPFFLIGGAVLIPGGKGRVGKWIDQHPGPVTNRSVKIVERFMDDLDSRYPRRR